MGTGNRSDVRPRHGDDPCGVILYDKPAGITSHDVVARVRKSLDARQKVGHAGTLDPFATGLLLILIGRATRIQRYLMALPKTYLATARFGATSSTGDPEGEIVTTGVVPEGDLVLPTGRIRQVPPAYSALKLSGQRAYALARAGHEFELSEREVEVSRFVELWRRGEHRGFEVQCSSGTYVRSLIADLGDAYCEELRRTAIGPFSVGDANPDRTLPLDDALGFLPERRLGPEEARRAAHGGRIPLEPGDRVEGPLRLTDEAGLIAVAEGRPQEGVLQPTVVLRD
ncbi:MAG: tRNA pseudouridine(55) synthase TruB [Solirubrobacterales bacterium]|nr:tRNA pseudouridine(55) synthase TruB [Solirubrobacterales bacterium]